ncbi:MAG: hypothetical protein QW683_08400 [Candidatus Caldarchaeum sp.]
MTVKALYEALGRVETGVAAVRCLARDGGELDDARNANLEILLATLARWQEIQRPSYWFEIEMPVHEWWTIQRVFERVERELATAVCLQVFCTAKRVGELLPIVLQAKERPVLMEAIRDALLIAGLTKHGS